MIFHVLNRGVRKARLFETDDDYAAFLDIVVATMGRHPIAVFAYCIMPNHFHFLMSPAHDGQLSRFMQIMTVTHSKRWHQWRGTNGTGHVYQGRFKAFAVQNDRHFLRVCRYVERNALRARLSTSAEAWPWGSAHQWQFECPWIPLTRWPVARPPDWLSVLNTPDEADLSDIRRCLRRNRPFGENDWVRRTSGRLALDGSLVQIGRPRNKPGIVLRVP